jgi:hypothetical protein
VKGPRRLIEENELFASLVDDAQKREPSPEALNKLLDVLDSPVATPTAPARARLRLTDPWIGLALVGAGALAVLGYSTLDRPRERPPVAAVAPSNAAPARETRVASPIEHAPEAVPSLSISELPDSKETPSRARTIPARPASSAPSAAATATATARPAAGRELELIARAREALTRGDARACLAALAQHDAEFPNGQFMPEAAVMKIEATHASGDRAGARTLARTFLAKSPESPYAARIRSLLATLEQE